MPVNSKSININGENNASNNEDVKSFRPSVHRDKFIPILPKPQCI